MTVTPSSPHPREQDQGTVLPATPAGQTFAELLAVINSGDEGRLRRFVAARYAAEYLIQHPLDRHVLANLRVFRWTGGLVPDHVEHSEPYHLSVRLHTQHDGRCYRMALTVTPAFPHAIRQNDTSPLPREPTGLVAVGGYRLALKEAGTGRPPVILEAGMGGLSEAWAWVFESVAAFTHVLSYDRAGQGNSEAAPTPRTCMDLVHDLHALLAARRIPRPCVLVGHSFGGFVVRLYAQQHPRAVAGMVLVDASHADYPARMLAALPPPQPGEGASLTRQRRFLAHDRYDTTRIRKPEQIDIVTSTEQARRATVLGARPLVVLTAGRPEHWPPDFPSNIATRLWHLHQELQRDLTHLSSHSTQTVVAESWHNIHMEQPEAVIAAIRQVVDAVRAGGRRSTPEGADR